jgi:hypothetical protein
VTGAWGGHQAAVYVAINNVGELQEALSMATDACERAIGAVLEGTGESHVESAQNAVSYLAGVKERVQECFGMSETAKAELQRYMGGF